MAGAFALLVPKRDNRLQGPWVVLAIVSQVIILQVVLTQHYQNAQSNAANITIGVQTATAQQIAEQ